MLAFFVDSSPLNLKGPFHDLPKNLENFCPLFDYGESRISGEHLHTFKEIYSCKDIAHQEKVFKEAITFMNQMDPHAGGKFMAPPTLDNAVLIPPCPTKVPTMPTMPNQMP